MIPDHITASNIYGRYCVPRSSCTRPAARTIIAGKVWEKDTIRFVAQNCGNGDVVHAGAFFGDFLPGLSQALHPDARLWAFEPSRENFLCAQETVALNGLANVVLANAGLGARQGTGTLCVSADGEAHGGASWFVAQESAGEVYETVPIVALDDVIPKTRDVSVLQLDVEEYEQQALEGALDLLSRCRPLVILETLPKNQEWYERNILAMGYREIGPVHNNRVLAPSDVEPRIVKMLNTMNVKKAERKARRRAARQTTQDDPAD